MTDVENGNHISDDNATSEYSFYNKILEQIPVTIVNAFEIIANEKYPNAQYPLEIALRNVFKNYLTMLGVPKETLDRCHSLHTFWSWMWYKVFDVNSDVIDNYTLIKIMNSYVEDFKGVSNQNVKGSSSIIHNPDDYFSNKITVLDSDLKTPWHEYDKGSEL